MRINKVGHNFLNFIKKTHPTINQSKYTIVTDQDKGSLSVIGHGIGGKVIPAKMARLAESQSLE